MRCSLLETARRRRHFLTAVVLLPACTAAQPGLEIDDPDLERSDETRAELYSSFRTHTPGERAVGRATLSLPGGQHVVHIEDASPDVGSTAGGSVDIGSTWGVMFGLSASGPEQATSAATSWTSRNGSVVVDHVAAADGDGHLMVFYWSPDDPTDARRTGAAAWKAVDVTEKTSRVVAVEQPCGWRVQQGADSVEHLAGRDTSGHLIDFSWLPGGDWTAFDVSASAGRTIAGPVGCWTGKAGDFTREMLVAHATGDELVLFEREAGSSWQARSLSDRPERRITATPVGWRTGAGLDRVAAAGRTGELLLFSRGGDGVWTVVNVTDRTTVRPRIQGRVTAWEVDGVQHIAARTLADHLVIFRENTIEGGWSVEDVTAATGGSTISAPPIHWLRRGSGAGSTVRLAAPGPGRTDFFRRDHVLLFHRDGRGQWAVLDLSASTGVRISLPLTAWTTAVAPGARAEFEHLAAPTADGRMHVLNHAIEGRDWSSVDVSLRSAGRIVYAGTPYAGVWISEDYGLSWHQSTRPQPGAGETRVPGALQIPTINDVAVSPVDPDLVFAAGEREGRVPSLAGVYRSTDRGRTWRRVHLFDCNGTVSGPSQIVFAPDDPQRIYVAGGCMIAISTDGGMSWSDVRPMGADTARRAWHVAVGARQSRDDDDRVVVATGESNLWLSRRGGRAGSWVRDTAAAAILPPAFAPKTDIFRGAPLIALDPTDPLRVYLAHITFGVPDANGPSYLHSEDVHGLPGVRNATPVVYDTDDNAFLSAGDVVIDDVGSRAIGAVLADDPALRFVDTDGSGRLSPGEAVVFDTNEDGVYQARERVLRGMAPAAGTRLADDRRIRYVVQPYMGPPDPARSRYGRPNHTSTGVLWHGDLTAVTAADPTGRWTQLPGPPVYTGAGSSGAVFVRTHPQPQGHLVFFGDRSTVQVSEGRPGASGWAGWFRLAGINASEGMRARPFVHVDPHDLAFSPDFRISLRRSSKAYPLDMNAELAECGGGRLWMANDGGVHSNDDCGRLIDGRSRRWQPAITGLSTLWTLNVVGTARRDEPRALYAGTEHDDDFFSMDDGLTWRSAEGGCGDCDTWWGDLFQPSRVLRLSPRFNRFDVFHDPGSQSPDASASNTSGNQTQVPYVDGMQDLVISHTTIPGYRPVVQSLPRETPPAMGDYIALVQVHADTVALMRARDSIDPSATNSGFARIGPPLSSNTFVVQAAGGHDRPVFLTSSRPRLGIWRGETDATGRVRQWDRIVPSADGIATDARRFFVNPWDPDVVYVLDLTGIRMSDTGGTGWRTDNDLTAAIGDGGAWDFGLGLNSCSRTNCLLNDMAFDPTDPDRRFAAGLAGVFMTLDGQRWHRLLDTRALPSRPLGLWFDPITDPDDATLYVATFGRGILRIHPIPR